MPSPAPSPAPPVVPTPQQRILAAGLMGGVVLIGVALAFVLPLDESPPGWVTIGLVGAGVAVHLGLDAFGYRPSGADPVAAFRAGMILRSAFAEAVAVVAAALAFVLPEGGFATYAVGAGVAIALMGIHVWPSARAVGRQRSYDRS